MSLESVRRRVDESAIEAGRRPEEVRLVVVSKERTVSEIQAVYDAGQRDFGENRAQELGDKVELLPGDIRWHFVGPLQSNKVRIVRPVVTLLHSMDRVSLASAWMKGPGRPPPALLQVNVGREPQKHGLDPDETVDTWREITGLGVELIGLMAIPPLPDTPEASRPYFSQLRSLRDQVAELDPRCQELSMGMTDDFEVAVSEGATVIRVGRAIFEG